MTGDERLDALLAVASRCEELAETAELMGDDDAAHRLRDLAARRRLDAMDHLDPTN